MHAVQIIRILLIILILFSGPVKNGSCQDSLKKPVVALVLSGGSAKGLAHIGVLQLLEETGIKPDIIVGTSMGSIVGGLYSIGYSVDELKEIANTTDWLRYLSNDTDLRNMNMEEKDDYEDYLYAIPFQSGKPEIAKGLIYAHEMDLFLSKLTFPAYKFNDFDSFPVRFRAISADVIKGEAYVFKDGPLSVALRASMSLPSLLYPVSYKDMLLVDGGVIDNFGVEYALKSGADIVIGSNVGNYLYGEKELGSFPKIYSQLIMINSKKKLEKYRDSVDVLIEPPVLDMSTRFDKSAQIIESGYMEASKYTDQLKKIAENLSNYRLIEKSQPGPRLRVVQIEGIEINGINRVQARYDILDHVRKHLKSYNGTNTIEHIIGDLYGTGQYAFINYYLQRKENNKYNLILNFKKISSNILQVGINYNDQSDMGLVLGFTSRNYLFPASKFKVTGRISNYPGLDQYFAKYFIRKANHGIKQTFSYIYDELPVFSGSSKTNEYSRNILVSGLSYLFIPDKYNMIEIGFQNKSRFLDQLFMTQTSKFERSSSYKNNFFLSYFFNNVTDKFYPREGNVIKLTLAYTIYNSIKLRNIGTPDILFKPEPHPEIDLSFKNFVNINNKITWENEIGFKYSSYKFSEPLVFYDYSFGGVIPDNKFQATFWGLPNNYKVYSNVGIIRTAIRYKLVNKAHIRTALNAALANEWKEYFGGGISLELDLPTGPLSLGISKSLNYKYPVFHFNLGFFR
ncbi:MAG: patatin-like phospholipase family protein [Deltaproteobacteria bacterium]